MIPYKDIKFTKDKIIYELPDITFDNVNDNNKLPDNLEVIGLNIEAIGFDPKDAPKIKKLVRLKNKRDKLDKEIKKLEDSLIKED